MVKWNKIIKKSGKHKMIHIKHLGKFKRYKAFTLAEVVIVLGIIGIIAEVTIPQLVHDVQEAVLKSQFQKAYSSLSNMISRAKADMGPYDCYYWEKNPYGSAYCAEYSADGSTCTKYLMQGTNEPLASDYNGRFTDCADFTSWFERSMSIIKKCTNNSYANGCIPDIKGQDTLKIDSGMTEAEALTATVGLPSWRKSSILNNDASYVFKDGTYMILPGSTLSMPAFVLDINGQKKPNKWGYDIFQFYIRGNFNGVTKVVCESSSATREPGGKTCEQMMLNSK